MKQGMKFEPKCHQTCQIFDVLFQTVSCFVNRKSNLVIFFVPNHAKTCSFSARRSLVFFCSVFFFLLDAKILFRYFVHTFGFVFNTSTFQTTLWLTRVRSRAFVWCCLQLVLCIYDWNRERKQFKQFLLANTWNIQSLDFRDSFDLNTSREKKNSPEPSSSAMFSLSKRPCAKSYFLIAGSHEKSKMAEVTDVPENAPERKLICHMFLDLNKFDLWVLFPFPLTDRLPRNGKRAGRKKQRLSRLSKSKHLRL